MYIYTFIILHLYIYTVQSFILIYWIIYNDYRPKGNMHVCKNIYMYVYIYMYVAWQWIVKMCVRWTMNQLIKAFYYAGWKEIRQINKLPIIVIIYIPHCQMD